MDDLDLRMACQQGTSRRERLRGRTLHVDDSRVDVTEEVVQVSHLRAEEAEVRTRRREARGWLALTFGFLK